MNKLGRKINFKLRHKTETKKDQIWNNQIKEQNYKKET